MVARLVGRRGAHQVGVDQREVIGTLRETSRRFVNQRDVGNRVKTGIVGLGRVIGPLGTLDTTIDGSNRHVLGSEAEEDDRVGETNVEAGTGRDILEGRDLCLLDLRNQHITTVLTNLGTLILVDDCIVSIGRGVDNHGADRLTSLNHVRLGGRNTEASTRQTTDRGGSGIDNDEILPVTEGVVDANLIEGQRTSRESNTRILGEVEGEGHGEVSTGTQRVGATLRQSGTNGVGHGRNITNHVTVSNTLGSRLAELEVKVEPERLKLLNREVIEGQSHLLKKIVHQVASPTDRAVHEETSRIRMLELNLGDLAAEPDVENIITRTGNQRRNILLVKVNRSRVAKLNWNVRKPITLLQTCDKPSKQVGEDHVRSPFCIPISCMHFLMRSLTLQLLH